MSAINIIPVRNALQAWVAIGSGLAGDHVIWFGQKDANGTTLPRPNGMFIELRLSLLGYKGQADQRLYEFHEDTNTYTDRIQGQRAAVLTATCFEGSPTGGNETDGTSALSVLNDVMTACAFDNVYDSLVAANVAICDFDNVPVGGTTINSVRFEARAVLTVKLGLASELTYTFPVGTGWIDRVNAAGEGDASPIAIHVNSPHFEVTMLGSGSVHGSFTPQ